jgi:uncharacterized protein YhjY with autotransporter beta-barrel domain
MQLYAACQIISYTMNGYVIVCDGPDTIGIASGDGNDIITINVGADVTKTDVQSVEATAATNAIVIDAGSGNNLVTNNGSIGATADANAFPVNGSASQATANAAGISAEDGADSIQNSSTIAATANAKATTEDMVLTAAGDSSIVAGTSTTASATGISAGTGSNTITNTDTITVTADAEANALGIELQLMDKASVDTGVTADAKAVGILSSDSDGNGSDRSDTIINSGTITTNARAEADSSEVRRQAMDWSVSDATSSAKAEAIGIKSGPGSNVIENYGTILSTATAESDLWTIEDNLTDWGLASSGLTVESKATGIEGNDRGDQITNSGSITAAATSEADKVSINFSFVDFTVGPGFWGELLGSSAGSADTLSKATAVGISGEGGDDTISNTGTINSLATAALDGTAVSVGAEGIPKSIIDVLQGSSLASSSPTAETSAIGIHAGDGKDTITNEGYIKVEAFSTADDISVNLSLPLLEWAMDMPSPAFALGGAGVTALAEAVGIEGGKGDDAIYQEGLIDVDATSETLAVTASVAIQGVFDDINYFDLQTSVADASIKSESVATGIDGGEGDDIITVTSTGTINSDATATADGITVAVGIQGKIKEALNVGASIARADTKAIAAATGIEGSKGDDTINNAGTVTANADASALSVGVSVEAQLSVKKAASVSAAIVDISTQAWATATGISVSEGDDRITNSGKIIASATPEADSTSVSVDFQNVEEGLAVGISYADATTTAVATATGIDSGAGNDIITNTNTGEITVAGDSESTSASIGVTVSGSFSQEWSAVIGGAITDGTTKAISNVAGIKSGEGEDTITNSGKIIADALSDADSASVSVDLVGAKDGLTLGFTYADSTTTAEANAVGIDGGSGNDTITNTSTGQIEVTANPTSSSASVGVTLTGVTKGTGIVGGAALTDGTTKAIGNATGISGGGGDDTIINSSKMIVKAMPDADSASVSVNLGAALGELGLVGGFSYADATTTAQANAIGIDGGTGKDTITNTGEIEVTTEPTASSVSIGVTDQGVKGTGAAVGVSLTDGTTKAISTATGIAGGEGNDTIINSGKITVKALPDADSASVSVSISASKEGVAAGGTFADTTTTAQATATGIDGGQGNDTITNSGEIEVAANSTSSSASIGATITGVKEGAGLGVALTDGTTKAISTATGIKGGDGNNTITNSSNITATSTSDSDSASVSATLGGTGEGLVAGVSYADATTTAEATAIGIGTGSGNDIIQNEGLLNIASESTSTSASVAVNAGGAVEGAAVGVALTDAETKATSSSIGIESGEGEDILTNTGTITASAKSDVTAASVSVDFAATGTGLAGGAALANGDTTVDASAIGMNGGGGKGTISNDNVISVGAESTSTLASISVAVHGTPEGISLGAALASASNNAKASAIGIQGGDDNDTMTNNGTITTSATSKADTTSVALDAECAPVGLGASLAKANTTAQAIATGLSGGSGNDEITNTGTINADSSATGSSKAISVSIATASYSSADVVTTATAKSIGMDGGSGADKLRNEGTINLNATSNADGKAGSANLTGYAAADVDITAEATTTGIDGGAEYNDIDNLVNTGTIKTVSDATAKGLSVSVNLLGGVATDANTTASAITTGIKGGAGDDPIFNQGNIDLTAKSNADVLGISVTLGGYSDSNAESKGESTATGINAGNGSNTIISTGSIKVSCEAYADTASVSVNLLGYAAAKGGATASATTIGITSGKDADSIQNEEKIDLNALSDTYASAASVQLIGYGESNAKGISNATVKGIDGGDGNNTIINTSTGVITGTATAYADASSYDIQLSGGAKATAGTASVANAIGITGGKEMDCIRNEGTIHSTAQSTLVSSSKSYKIFGVGTANADSAAETIATGIDGGDGANTITNASTGSITVSSNASATATSMTANIGVAGSSASTTSKAHSTGVKSGDDQDTILNEGNISVTATSSTGAAGGSFSLAGLSFGDSLTDAITDGINAGGGNDTVINTGSITVGSVQDNNHPMAYSDVESVSFSFFGLSSVTFGSKAQATGIIGGGGDDTILNTGTITVGDDDWMAKGRGYGFSGNFFEFFSLTSVGATAETIATGIDGGDGNDIFLNDTGGVLTVKATSYAEAEGSGDTTFGSPVAFASSTTKAAATGISGGEGGDVIENKGTIDVYAHTLADAYSDSFAGWGSPRADSAANATATAAGVDAGKGQNFLTNSGSINVSALAETRPYAKANSDIDTTDAEATSYSKTLAFGIKAGEGDDVIQNQGHISVTATAEKATSDDQRTTAWTDEVAKVGTSKNDPGIRSSATATGISAGGGTNQITNDGTIDVTATATGDGYAFAESDAYDTETLIWAVVDATATGVATGTGSSQIINNGTLQVSSIASSEIYSDSDSVDDADATAGATVSAKAWGIDASGSNTLVINAGTLDVDASATVKGNSRADSAGDGYGTAIFESNSNADAVGIATGEGGAIWNQAQAQITVDAKAIIDASANGDEFGTMGTSKENPGAIAVAKAVGIYMDEGDNQVINDGSISINAEGNINVGTRSLSTTRSTHTNTWALTDATAAGLTVGKGESSITNTGELEVKATSIADLNDPDSGTGTYWRSDSYYNADAKTGAYASSHSSGIDASADNSDNPGNTMITNSGTVKVTSVATAKGNSRGDSGAGDGNATTNAEASADASGFVGGSGNKLVSIENSGTLEVKSTADTLAYAHGDDNSYAYAKSLGYAYGIEVGNSNELVSIKNSGTLKVESTETADAKDDEPTMNSESSAVVYGIKIGNSNSVIANSGVLDIKSTATATIYSDEGPAASTISSAYATGIGTGDETNTISNSSLINVIATAESNPNGGNSNSTNTATAQAIGIKTGSNNDTITLGTNALVNAAAHATTFSYNGVTNASVIGIDAGNGDNFVANYGTIDVSALAVAGTGASPKARTDGVESTTAIGIMTGDGNDTIINNGSITTANESLEWVGSWIHITSQPGTAISSGGGNDTVILTDGSETKGHIDLGDGDDWLTVMGTPLVTGNVTGAAGTDTLVFEGAGSIGFIPMAFENAIKQGAGTYTMPNLPTMQRIEVNQGTLQINSDYTMANDSTFQAKLNGDASHGQLNVNGTAQLDGTLKVIRGPGAYINGTKYDVLLADTVNGWFSSEILPEPTRLLSFRVNSPRDHVEIEALVKSFTTVTKNPVHSKIAQHLDKILPQTTGDLSYVLGQFQLLSDSEFSRAFSSLSPDSYNNFTNATHNSTWQYNRSLQRRMNTIRSYSSASGNDLQTKPLLLAYNGSDASIGQFFTPGQLSQLQGKNGLWFNGFGQWGDQDEEDGFTGFDYNMWGTTLGFDHTFGDKLMAGLSLGYSRTDIDLDRYQGNGDINSLFGSLYGSYFSKNAYIEGVLSYGKNWYHNNRLIVIGPIQREAYSSHHGDAFSAYIGGGYHFDLKDWALGPFASLRYIYLDEESFRETGADSLNLWVDHRKTDSLISELGLRVARIFKSKYGRLIPELSAAWSYDFDIDDRAITTSFAGAPSAEFSIQGQEVERSGAILGAGLTFIHKSGFSTSLKYSGEFREGYKSHGVIGELRYTF